MTSPYACVHRQMPARHLQEPDFAQRLSELLARINRDGLEISACPVAASSLGTLIARIQDGNGAALAGGATGLLWKEKARES